MHSIICSILHIFLMVHACCYRIYANTVQILQQWSDNKVKIKLIKLSPEIKLSPDALSLLMDLKSTDFNITA